MSKFFELLNKSGTNPRGSGTQNVSTRPAKISANRGDAGVDTGAEVDKLGLDNSASDATERGTTPPISNGNMDPLLITFLEPQSQAAESFRLLAASIVSGNSTAQSRVIMVTSPQPLDGKSTVAANLGVAVGQELNKTAVLVDCDLRRPTLHQVFGLQACEGLHEYLSQGTSAGRYLLKTPIRNLSLIPGGRPSPSPAELLSSSKMPLLMEELKKRFRYVIADFAPTGFAADTAFLSGMVDGILLVARSRKTPKDMILEAAERLGRDRILGVVFNEDGEGYRRYQAYYKRYYTGKPK